jgi:hypothetical protein
MQGNRGVAQRQIRPDRNDITAFEVEKFFHKYRHVSSCPADL